MKFKRAVSLMFIFLLAACAAGNCREKRAEERRKSSTGAAVAETSAEQVLKETKGSNVMDRVKVYKPDGSLQCGMGAAVPLETMKKDLGNIRVYSQENTSDNLMHIALCGAPTGKINVYEIDRENLKEALAKGFKVFE
jgi:hypothetical protein